MELILATGQQFFLSHCGHWHFMMLACIHDHLAKELSFGSMNECMRAKDGCKGSQSTSGTEKNPRAGYLATLSVRVENAVTDSFPRQRNRAFMTALQELLRFFQLKSFGGVIGLL